MKKALVLSGLLVGLILVVCGCAASTHQADQGSITVSSPAFGAGEDIPARFTCNGEEFSPELAWSGIPEETRSLALVMDDPDAFPNTFTHWVVYNLPPDTQGLAENISAGNLPDGGIQGLNSINQNKYMGPCPPMGGQHRYYFTLYAADLEPDLPEGLTTDALKKRLSGHQLAYGELMGIYQQ